MDIQKNYILKLAADSKRIDGRNFEDFREIVIEKNPISNAEGSARVKIGDTDVLVGVKMEVAKPFPDKADEGVLMVSAELSPIASANFETGPPREEAIELARVVDRGIRESGAVDTKKLCITPGEKVWMVCIDVQILNFGGNLIDAYSIASAIALNNAKMPKYDEETEKADYSEKTESLPIKAKPIAVTVFKMESGQLFVDPNEEEENAAIARLTVTTTETGNVTAMQKGGSSFTLAEIVKAIEISLKNGDKIRKML